MTRKLKGTLIAAPVVAALVFGGVAIAGATGGSDDGEGTPIGGTRSIAPRRSRSSRPAVAASPRPRSATRRAITRSRSPAPTAARPTCTSPATSA